MGHIRAGVDRKEQDGSLLGGGSSLGPSQQRFLHAHNMQGTVHTQLPVPKEWLDVGEDGGDDVLWFSDEDLKRGQKAVGEALWLAMKTRPDVLFVVNHMAANVAKRPVHVEKMGQRPLSYLAGTADLELVLRPPSPGEP